MTTSNDRFDRPSVASAGRSTASTADVYEVVLLDLDLTLFDFHASEAESLAACLSLVGIDDCHAVFPRYREINQVQWARVERGELSPSEAGRRRFEILLAELGIVDADPADLSDHRVGVTAGITVRLEHHDVVA